MEQARFPRFRSRSWRATLVFTLVLIGLLCLTTWNLTRSVALLEARRAYVRGDLAHCLQHALDHLDRRPWSREAALWAARSLSRLDYSGEAELYFQRAGHLTLNDAQIRAYGLVRGPHSERAVPVYNEILARSPENVTALRRLAAVELAQNNTGALLKLADRLGHISNGAVIGITLRAVVYHNDKNPQQAVAAFERLLELDPELREMPMPRRLFWSHFADDLIASGRMDDARRYLSKALIDAPDAELINRLGQAYFLQGALDDAERCFGQAADLNPSDYAPHLSLAKLALQRHHQEEALKHLNQARVLAPRQYDVLYNLAAVYRQLGRTAEADRIQEAIKQLRGNSSSSSRPTNSPWPRYAL
ncbi:MAG: tetratricopeptide repeat protein [Isosphaerales bacterium]